MGTVFLIFLLLVLCGFIAYIGDLLGRRFGKKRLSVFNLRPKHTAILLTVATGVVIAAVTLTVAIASVPGFREVVTQGERLANQNRRYAVSNQQLAQENARRVRENTTLESRNSELSRTTAQLQQEKGRLTDTNRRLDAQNDTLSKQNQAFQAQNQQLQGRNRTLAGQNRGLQTENQSLATTNRKLEGTARELGATNRRLASEKSRLQKAQVGLQRQVAGLKQDEARYRQVLRDYREDAYVFRRNDEIERRVVPANAPEELLWQTVTNLLYSANTKARDRNGIVQERSLIRLVPHRQHPEGMTNDPTRLVQWAVQRARSLPNAPVVVRVVADENCIRGKDVPARLECYPNDQVFRKDEVIAATRIAVLETTFARPRAVVLGQILEDLVYFLQKEVGPTATSAPHAMIPSDEAVGELRYSELLPVCERIYELGADGMSVRVVARARQSTLRAGPLLVWLDVEPQRTAGRGR